MSCPSSWEFSQSKFLWQNILNCGMWYIEVRRCYARIGEQELLHEMFQWWFQDWERSSGSSFIETGNVARAEVSNPPRDLDLRIYIRTKCISEFLRDFSGAPAFQREIIDKYSLLRFLNEWRRTCFKRASAIRRGINFRECRSDEDFKGRLNLL
jgi:hypothetical protein